MAGKRRRRKRKADRLVWLLPAALVLVLVVVLILWAARGSRDGEAAMSETEAAENTEPGENGTGEGTEAGTEAGTEVTDTETQAGEIAAETEEQDSAASQPAVAAEVGSMEDAEDPQEGANAAGSGSGASVDVSQVQPAAGEVETATLGIDVSKYQGTIDWAQVKEAGVEFAMIRVGYRTKSTGIIYEDPGARYNLQEATANGIKAGAYFFSSAITEEEAREEAAWVNSFIAKYKITYPVAYNCEDFQSEDSRQYALTREERTKLACAFLDTVAAGGYTPMFYASRNEMEGSSQWDMDTLGKYRVWVSQYPAQPFPSTPSSSYSGSHAMWQYTNKGKVAGIKTDVDVNIAYFGYSQEAEAKDSAPAEPVEANPEVGIEFTEVNEQVTAKDKTNLRALPTTENSQVVYQLPNGETVQRTGIGSNGWDRVIYNGQKLYAVHNFLTTELTAAGENGSQAAPGGNGNVSGTENAAGTDNAASDESTAAEKTSQTGGMVFRDVSEAVTARDQVNLRDKPSTDTGNIVGSLSYGEAVVRTGISDSGWSRLEVNGQVVYASSRLLATSMDYKETEKPTTENPEAGMHFVAAAGMVKAKSGETNLRTLPTTSEPSQVIAQLTGDATAQLVSVEKDRGWSKLVYNGQIVYAVSSYLTAAE